jgi:hypothetical protein
VHNKDIFDNKFPEAKNGLTYLNLRKLQTFLKAISLHKYRRLLTEYIIYIFLFFPTNYKTNCTVVQSYYHDFVFCPEDIVRTAFCWPQSASVTDAMSFTAVQCYFALGFSNWSMKRIVHLPPQDMPLDGLEDFIRTSQRIAPGLLSNVLTNMRHIW